jgi:electron transfer flavoprotein alpha subunit
MMIGATNNGRDLGPRVSCRLNTGLTADCTALDIDEESGNVAWTRPAFGGNLMATILCPDHRPQIGTVRPGVFKKSEAVEGKAEIIKEDIHVPADRIRTQILEVLKEMGDEKVDLEGAEIIVSGGRGVGGPDGFEPIRALAKELGATVGASRAAVDAGWIGHAHQVGQTGKTVGPKLYIACGISGAIQHLAGMSGSDCIVAINKDPDAPIFDVADYGVVGDLFEVLPILTEEIKKARA